MTTADAPTPATPAGVAASATIATTAAGTVRGVLDGGIHSFLGVPYAAPPTGPRRFRAPAPPEPWSEVRDCTRPGPTATQPVLGNALMPQTLIEGDDHLHVNVHTADLTGSRPVLVWIHGGGMTMGSNADVDGRALARRGLVVVAANYRLGCDGFVCLDGAPANRGVLDWVAALEWVRDNVAAFGGDPGNVTIAGQSAGSAACLTLAVTPRATGLFRRVVAMSGVPWNMVDEATACRHADELAARLGVERTAEAFAGLPLDRLTAEVNTLAPIGGIGGGSAPGDPRALFHHVATLDQWIGPVVDGDLIPVSPDEAFAAGAGGDLAVVVGSTLEEMDALMTLFGGSLTAEDATTALAGLGLDPGAVTRWLAAEPERTAGQALGRALTALSFRIPGLRLAEVRAAAGAAPTYVYETTWRPPTPLGAVHAYDVPYVFDTIDDDRTAMVAGGPPPRSLADDMASALVRFAATGDPGWPPYRPDDRNEMAFDVPSRLRTDPDPLTRALFSPIR